MLLARLITSRLVSKPSGRKISSSCSRILCFSSAETCLHCETITSSVRSTSSTDLSSSSASAPTTTETSYNCNVRSGSKSHSRCQQQYLLLPFRSSLFEYKLTLNKHKYVNHISIYMKSMLPRKMVISDFGPKVETPRFLRMRIEWSKTRQCISIDKCPYILGN